MTIQARKFGLIISTLILTAIASLFQSSLNAASPILSPATGYSGYSTLTYGATIYVDNDHLNASDTNDGLSTSSPKESINAGLIAAKDYIETNNAPVRVLIMNGIYRESVSFSWPENTQPIIIEPQSSGNVVISGSDLWNSDWINVGEGLYERDWVGFSDGGPVDSDETYGGDLSNQGQNRSLVFEDGERLNEVFNQFDLSSTPGSYYYHQPTNLIRIHTTNSTEIESKSIEVGIRSTPLSITDTPLVVIKDIIVENAPSSSGIAGLPAVNLSLEDSYISGLIVRDSNWNGLGLSGTDITVSNSHFYNNGGSGLSCDNCENVVFDSNLVDNNNWRGSMGGLYDGVVANSFQHSDRVTIMNHISEYNLTAGISFNYNDRNVLITDSMICDNRTRGIMIGSTPGPFEITSNNICDTRAVYGGNLSTDEQAGLYIDNGESIFISGNNFYNNTGSQISNAGSSGSTTIEGDVEVENRDWTIENNNLSSLGHQAIIDLNFDSDFETYVFENNIVYGEPHICFHIGYIELNFEDWQEYGDYGFDNEGSAHEDPEFQDPEERDFTTPASNTEPEEEEETPDETEEEEEPEVQASSNGGSGGSGTQSSTNYITTYGKDGLPSQTDLIVSPQVAGITAPPRELNSNILAIEKTPTFAKSKSPGEDVGVSESTSTPNANRTARNVSIGLGSIAIGVMLFKKLGKNP